eukprot:158068-Amphidinium_carterae.1
MHRPDLIVAHVVTGMVLRWRRAGAYEGGDGFFSATHWTKLTADHWEVSSMQVVEETITNLAYVDYA